MSPQKIFIQLDTGIFRYVLQLLLNPLNDLDDHVQVVRLVAKSEAHDEEEEPVTGETDLHLQTCRCDEFSARMSPSLHWEHLMAETKVPNSVTSRQRGHWQWKYQSEESLTHLAG